MNGERVYPTYKTYGEALKEKQRLENEAADFAAPKGEVTYLLKEPQLRDAEQAMALLDHGTLTDAARFYVANHVPIQADKALADAYPLFLADKQDLRKLSLRAYNYDLKLLVDAHPALSMNDMSKHLLRSFLKSADPIPGHPQISRPFSSSRQNYLLRVYAPFFSWGINEGYCGTNPAKMIKIKAKKKDDVEPAILALLHLQRLLDVSWVYLGGKYAAYCQRQLFFTVSDN